MNARDDEGNTPLHIVADPKSCSSELVQMLLTCGAHLDEANDARQTFESLSKEKVHTFVDPMPYLSLKCLAARVITCNEIVYDDGAVPLELKSFLLRH